MSHKEPNVAEQPDDLKADLILKAMIAVATADGGLDDTELSLIQQVYQDHAGKPISAEEIARAAEAAPRDSLLAELSAASPALDRATKEEIVRTAYLTLMADDRVAGEERKKLKDIAAALSIPEIHFGAILEDVAIWLAAQGQGKSR
jgi:tellurite resistance protein